MKGQSWTPIVIDQALGRFARGLTKLKMVVEWALDLAHYSVQEYSPVDLEREKVNASKVDFGVGVSHRWVWVM